MPRRDNNYYLKLLEAGYPSTFADLQAGKYASPGEAFRAAGLKKPRTRLQELKNAWSKASAAEQKQFDDWRTSISGVTPTPAPSAIGLPLQAIASDGRLEPWSRDRIEHIISVRRMRMGQVMDEIGYSRSNGSLGSALRRGWKLDDAMLLALEKWLQANSAIK